MMSGHAQAMRFHDARTGKLVRELSRPFNTRSLTSNAFDQIDPHWGRVVTVARAISESGPAAARVEVTDIATGRSLWTAPLDDLDLSGKITGTTAAFPVRAHFTPDGRRVVVVYPAKDRLRWVTWSAATGAPERAGNITTPANLGRRIADFTISPNGSHIALTLATSLGSNVPESLDVWNLGTGERAQRITGIGAGFGLIALCDDGGRVFATEVTPPPGVRGRLRVWDVATGREVLSVPLDYDPNPYKTTLRGLRYESGTLYIEHALWTRVLDGTPLPEAKE
jgi:WD40 repeat protein